MNENNEEIRHEIIDVMNIADFYEEFSKTSNGYLILSLFNGSWDILYIIIAGLLNKYGFTVDINELNKNLPTLHVKTVAILGLMLSFILFLLYIDDNLSRLKCKKHILDDLSIVYGISKDELEDIIERAKNGEDKYKLVEDILIRKNILGQNDTNLKKM